MKQSVQGALALSWVLKRDPPRAWGVITKAMCSPPREPTKGVEPPSEQLQTKGWKVDKVKSLSRV